MQIRPKIGVAREVEVPVDAGLEAGSLKLRRIRMRNTEGPFSTLLTALCLLSTAYHFAAPGMARAQLGVETLSPSSKISILTIVPGDEVYSLFGHTAIRIQDPEQGIDHTYNYGTFEFGDPVSFVARFAYGNLDYILSETSFPRMLAYYRDVARRPVIEQVLNLTHRQRLKIFEHLERNARPENRAYRYDFLFDNCSTRVRDAFHDRLDSLRFSSESVPDATFRHLLDRYAPHRPFLNFGWDLLLGPAVDRQAEAWETMFLPYYLMSAADSAVVTRGDLSEPFVASKDTLFWIEGRGIQDASAPWPSIVMWGIFWIGLSITILQRSGGWSGLARWFDAVLFAVVGLAGLIMLLMWTISLHAVTHQNWNLMWAWPTHLIAALPLLQGRRGVWLRSYLIAAALLATTALLGWAFWPQELPAAAIPLVLLLALRSAWRVFGTGVLRVRTARATAS